MKLYRNEGSDPKGNAQRNLIGRTHYVDDDTLRFHHSRILSARHTDNGLLFAIVESCGLDWRNTKRGYRYVIFDLFGTVLSRVDLEHCFKSSDKATKEMWAELNKMDADKVTREGIKTARKNFSDEMMRLIQMLHDLKPAKVPNQTPLRDLLDPAYHS